MDALLRRRQMMMAGGSPTPPGPVEPVFYDFLVFDGTAYIDTDITPANTTSFLVKAGEETIKGTQNFFMMQAGSGRTGAFYSTASTSTDRVITVYYGKSSAVGSSNPLAFSQTHFDFFLTPKRYGWDSTSFTISKGTTAPSGPIVIGGTFSHAGQQYTGVMGTFYIFGSDAQNVTTASGFGSFTPVYTLRPCTYNGEAGLWCVETDTFYGNTAGAGTLTVKNN